MTEIEFQSLVLEKLSNIDGKLETVDGRLEKVETRLEKVEKNIGILDKRVGNLETSVGNLETSVGNLETSVGNLETSLESLREEFVDFKSMTQEEFITTRKLINQAFDKISDNITYQDKITKIEEILRTSRRREFA